VKKKRVGIGIGLVVCLGGAWVLVSGQAQEKESDPVKLTPHMYKVRLENTYVRVLEYHSEPGEKEGMHYHPPGLVYSISEGRVRVTDRQGHTEEVALHAGEVSWRNKTWHASENTGQTEIHVLAIELKMPLEDLK
jgi:beta-alanine degradation protein BauB